MTHPYENRRDDGTNPGDQFRGPSSSDRDSSRFSEGWGGDRSGGGDLFDELNGSSTTHGNYDESSYSDYDQYNAYNDYDDDGSFAGFDESGEYESENYSDEGYEPVEYSGDYDGPAAYSGYDDGEHDSTSSDDDGSLDTFGGDKMGTILIGTLGALAVVASIVMMFTDSVTWMKVAGLAALWAGVVGGILTTKYRRQLVAERQRVREIEERHRVEMEKEVITHREQELLLEQNYLDSVDQDREEMLAQLRAEVQALREHLADIIGGSFDEERVALRARAERLRELEEANPAKRSSASSTPLKDPESFNRPTPRVHEDRSRSTSKGSTQETDEPVDVPVVDTPSESAGATAKADSASSFSTTGFRSVKWSPSGETSGQSSSAKKPAATAAPKSEPASEPTPTNEAKAAPAKASAPSADSRPTQVAPAKSRWAKSSDDQTEAHSAPKAEPKQEPARGANPSAAQSAAATNVMPQVPGSAEPAATTAEDSDQSGQANAPRGRRRAEDHAGGLTVAELLAQMRQNKD